MPTDPYYQDREQVPFAAPARHDPEPFVRHRRGLTGRRGLGAVLGLLLTPVGLGLLADGGVRVTTPSLRIAGNSTDWPGLGMVLGGALVLLAVALLGALSGLGPVLGGLVWGVFPGLYTLFAPDAVFAFVFDVLGGNAVTAGLSSLLAVGAVLAIGGALVGAGLAASLVRRRR
ncbi:hypothetical protein B0I33_11639 [Prauserella shujinwangii]|uniref:Uncharacterized protein n=1 Tax=Prauserella shujinwangii TaxID=1453103 RepID=A0A2T0LKI4_9PSEU|nr:hypothetical protein [Prauserella shujinwangii]PRX43306.1 hypothetical protein B0I33_11639 [Prauserella shujinwangii]